jgi:hypothetical protein
MNVDTDPWGDPELGKGQWLQVGCAQWEEAKQGEHKRFKIKAIIKQMASKAQKETYGTCSCHTVPLLSLRGGVRRNPFLQ